MTTYGESYATFTDVDRELSRAETEPRIIDRIEHALVVATDKLNQELGFDFFLHASGAWYPRRIDIDRHVIHAHAGIVSVTGIRFRTGRTADWEDFEDTDWDLETWANHPNAPYDHIVLNGTGTLRSSWPTGYERLVEVTGERGWATPPTLAVDANVDWARQDMAADRTFPGGTQTPDQTGFPARTVLPDSVIRLRQWALNRFACDI
jgi:hypothetical protein